MPTGPPLRPYHILPKYLEGYQRYGAHRNVSTDGQPDVRLITIYPNQLTGEQMAKWQPWEFNLDPICLLRNFCQYSYGIYGNEDNMNTQASQDLCSLHMRTRNVSI